MPRALALVLLASLLLMMPRIASAREIVHTVQKGQYLAIIAKRYHTTPEAIRENNKLKKGQTLQPGMKLRIVEVEEHRRWRKYYDEKVAAKNKPKKGGRSGASSPAQAADSAKDKNAKPASNDKAKDDKGKNDKVKIDKVKDKAKDETKPEKEPKATPAPVEPPRAPAPKRETLHPGSEPNSAPADEHTKTTTRPGYIFLARQDAKYRGQLVDAKGNVVAATAKRIDSLLRSRRSGAQHEIDRRLLKLLAQVSDHFGSRSIIVVSGYRPFSDRQYTKNSRHNHGKAIDFRVAGVPTEVLFEYCKGFRKVGCGYYPNSGFVHMDVREYKTQWTDYSKPGQPPIYAKKRERGIKGSGDKGSEP